MSIREIKLAAKQKIKGNWGLMIGTYIVMSLIVGATSFTGIGAIIIGGPLVVGFCFMTLKIVRGQKGDFVDLFSQFNNFSNLLVWYLLYNIFIFLWSLLFFIPGIVKSLAYSMSPYILADNPEVGGNEAITKSREMMDGHKTEFFLLNLSFIGYIILSIFTFGILLIWLIPYMEASKAEFYTRLKLEHIVKVEEVVDNFDQQETIDIQ